MANVKKKKSTKTKAERKNGKEITTKNPRAAGGPRKTVNWRQVDEMCKIQCTGEEMAAVLGIDYDTLGARCREEHGVKVSDYIEQKRRHGKASLRRRQWLAAKEGNTSMLIWLGKNWLNQTDNPEPPKDPDNDFEFFEES